MVNKNSALVRQAFEESLNVLGERGKKLLLSDLSTTLNISDEGDSFPTMNEIEVALKSLFGEGAPLLITRMQKILDSHSK